MKISLVFNGQSIGGCRALFTRKEGGTVRTFLTKAEAIAYAKVWLTPTPPVPAHAWEQGRSVQLKSGRRFLTRQLEEVHCLQGDGGGNGGFIIAITDPIEGAGGSVVAINEMGDHKTFDWCGEMTG